MWDPKKNVDMRRMLEQGACIPRMVKGIARWLIISFMLVINVTSIDDGNPPISPPSASQWLALGVRIVRGGSRKYFGPRDVGFGRCLSIARTNYFGDELKHPACL